MDPDVVQSPEGGNKPPAIEGDPEDKMKVAQGSDDSDKGGDEKLEPYAELEGDPKLPCHSTKWWKT